MNCIHCGHPYTYLLKDRQRKCSRCKRKFSPKKTQRGQTLHTLFVQGYTAREASMQSGMHFATIQTYYEKFRKNIALYCDQMHQRNSDKVSDYNEYLYLPKSLDPHENIGKIRHFLTLAMTAESTTL